MERYNKSVADNPKVTLIHISHDRDEDAAESWATAEQFPWLTVLPKDSDGSDLIAYRKSNGVPTYVMVDAVGTEVARGSSAIFSKVDELGAN